MWRSYFNIIRDRVRSVTFATRLWCLMVYCVGLHNKILNVHAICEQLCELHLISTVFKLNISVVSLQSHVVSPTLFQFLCTDHVMDILCSVVRFVCNCVVSFVVSLCHWTQEMDLFIFTSLHWMTRVLICYESSTLVFSLLTLGGTMVVLSLCIGKWIGYLSQFFLRELWSRGCGPVFVNQVCPSVRLLQVGVLLK